MLLPSPFDSRVFFACREHSSTALFDLSSEELRVAPRAGSVARRIEFALGRRAASEALKELGHRHDAPLSRVDRLPAWPRGVIGSISHTRIGETTYAVAALSTDPTLVGLGVDIEGIRPISERVINRIAQPDERAWIEQADSERRAITVFSAREALFKALSPLYAQPMLYSETELLWIDAERRFHGVTKLPRLQLAPIKTTIEVRYGEGVVITGVAIDAASWSGTR